MSETMQAIGAVGGREVTDPGSFVDLELPVPSPGPRDVLVRVAAVSVNPVDTKVRASLDPADPPRVLGFDAAATVEATGSEVTSLAVGDEVWYAGDINRPGSNAERQVVDERLVARRPHSVTAAQAASLPLTAITAWESLEDHLRLDRSATGTLLVLGGAGGVGSILVQLVKERHPGVRVIATASRPRSREWIAGLGADAVIDHHDLVAETRREAPGGVDYLFSTHSEGNEAAFAEILRPFGQIVAVDDPERVDLPLLKPKAIAWHWEFMFARPTHQTADMGRIKEILAEVATLVDDGRVRTTESETIEDFSAAGLRHAHAVVQDGHAVGKVVVTR